jgi:tetratricopeptide (TPR) repeat protein
MKEWVSLLTSAGAGLVASFISSFVVYRLKQKNEITYDVKFSRGKRSQITVPKSIAGNVDSTVQEIIYNALVFDTKLDSESRDEMKRLIAELEKQRQNNSLSARRSLLLARAYRNLEELEKAIDVLSQYISSSERSGPQHDEDLGKVYYNRACYWTLRGNFSSALEDLKRAFSLDSRLATVAKKDEDLTAIRERLKDIEPVI